MAKRCGQPATIFWISGSGSQRMQAGYLKATRYEWMFWDSGYRLEAWPV